MIPLYSYFRSAEYPQIGCSAHSWHNDVGKSKNQKKNVPPFALPQKKENVLDVGSSWTDRPDVVTPVHDSSIKTARTKSSFCAFSLVTVECFGSEGWVVL